MNLFDLKERIKKANESVQVLVGEAIAFSTDKSNDFQGRIQVAMDLEDFYPEESSFTGVTVDGAVSLYDDLHWERHQTMYLSDVVEGAYSEILDNADEHLQKELDSGDEEAQVYAIMEHFDGPWCRVVRAFLNEGIGSGVFDW